MKHTPFNEFHGEPYSMMPAKHPWHVRFMKSLLKFDMPRKQFRRVSLLAFGCVVADATLLTHNFSTVTSCEIAYTTPTENGTNIHRQSYNNQNRSWHRFFIPKSSYETLKACENLLSAIPVDQLISYEYSHGIVIPALAGRMIEGSPHAVGTRLKVEFAYSENPEQDRADVLQASERNRRYMVDDEMIIAGHTWSLDNLGYQTRQIIYKAGDDIEMNIINAEYWIEDQKRAVTVAIASQFQPPANSPN